MKQVINEYGRLIIMVILVIALLLFVRESFWKQLKSKISITQEPVKSEKLCKEYGNFPVLYGLETEGRPLALKLQAGTKFHPIETKGIIEVRAEDELDGDITDQIQVYILRDGKKEALLGELNTNGEERKIILLYAVENSSGFQTEKQISILITGNGGKA